MSCNAMAMVLSALTQDVGIWDSKKGHTTPSGKTLENPSKKASAANPWSREEEAEFAVARAKYKDGTDGRWDKIAAVVGTRTASQCKRKAQMDRKK